MYLFTRQMKLKKFLSFFYFFWNKLIGEVNMIGNGFGWKLRKFSNFLVRIVIDFMKNKNFLALLW